jgi:hypothetical protein
MVLSSNSWRRIQEFATFVALSCTTSKRKVQTISFFLQYEERSLTDKCPQFRFVSFTPSPSKRASVLNFRYISIYFLVRKLEELNKNFVRFAMISLIRFPTAKRQTADKTMLRLVFRSISHRY